MARKARFVIALSQPVPQNGTVTVNYSTSNDTAEAPSDYIAQSGSLVFTQGEQYKNVDVVLRDPEQDAVEGLVQVERLNLTVTSAVGSNGINATITPPPTRQASIPMYGFLERFQWGYDHIKKPSSGFFSWTYPNVFMPS